MSTPVPDFARRASDDQILELCRELEVARLADLSSGQVALLVAVLRGGHPRRQFVAGPLSCSARSGLRPRRYVAR